MNYHDRAQADIKIAKMLLDSNSSNDEAFYDAAAYHAQQGIEKELKHILHDIASVDDSTREFRTHNIDDLIDMVETQTDYVVSDQVKEMAEEITEWEANSRYGSSLVAAKEQIIKAIDLYHNEVQSLKQWTEEKHESDSSKS